MKVKPIWLSLVVIVCFLFVYGNYNSSPYDPVGLGLYALIRDNGFTLNIYDDYPLQFVVIAIFLIITSLLEKKAMIITGILLLMLLLAFWTYSLDGFIHFSKLSMIPFILSCIISIYILLRKEQDAVKIAGDGCSD